MQPGEEPDDPLAHLAAAAQRGDRDALTDLIHRTQRDVRRFLTPLTSPGDAEAPRPDPTG